MNLRAAPQKQTAQALKTLAAIKEPMRELPHTIYKYRSWNNLQNRLSLKNNEIYFARPKEFNDPFDCKITVAYDSFTSDDELFHFAKNEVMNSGYFDGKDEVEILREVDRVIRIIKSDIPRLQTMNDTFILDKINEHIGIFSASKLCDNFLLWSHYADYHQGFCIGYDTKLLKEALGESNGGSVEYSDDYPKFSPFRQVELLTSWYQVNFKAKCWEYEQEFRISKLYKEPNDLQKRVSFISDECLKEIVLGVKIKDKDKFEILEIASMKNIEVFEMKQQPYSFKLIKEKI